MIITTGLNLHASSLIAIRNSNLSAKVLMGSFLSILSFFSVFFLSSYFSFVFYAFKCYYLFCENYVFDCIVTLIILLFQEINETNYFDLFSFLIHFLMKLFLFS